MSTTAMIGWVVVALALAACTVLVFWCRRTIEMVAKNGFRSAREIEKELSGEG